MNAVPCLVATVDLVRRLILILQVIIYHTIPLYSFIRIIAPTIAHPIYAYHLIGLFVTSLLFNSARLIPPSTFATKELFSSNILFACWVFTLPKELISSYCPTFFIDLLLFILAWLLDRRSLCLWLEWFWWGWEFVLWTR